LTQRQTLSSNFAITHRYVCYVMLGSEQLLPNLLKRWKLSSVKLIRDVLMCVESHWIGNKAQNWYTGWAKKVSLIIFVITLSIASQFSYFLAHIHYKKFATGGYIVCRL